MTRINDSHIGWWCEFYSCSTIERREGCECLIPVFAPLAVPELSTETRADMEACVGLTDNGFFVLCDDAGHSGSAQKRWASVAGDAYNAWNEVAEGLTEADAVLYVCEGKLPGGEP